MDKYSKEAKEKWGNSEAYKEFEKKNNEKSKEDVMQNGADMMKLFAEFGSMLDENPASEKVQIQVKKLQDFITEHYYTCTKEILVGLGKMYSCDERFKDNIDKMGGQGTAAFVTSAIEIYCS